MPKKSTETATTTITEISGYTILPIQLPAVLPLSFPQPVTHYIYIRPHEPRVPSADAARSLFLVNVPIDTTELHLRHLFSSQLSAGRVEKVLFEDVFGSNHHHHLFRHTGTGSTTVAGVLDMQQQQQQQQGKKRKRQEPTSQELEAQMREEAALPSTWDREIRASGSHAIVTFVDKPAMEASLKAVRKAAARRFAVNNKKGRAGTTTTTTAATTIIWGDEQGIIEDRIGSTLGISRYRKHVSKLRYPGADELLDIVNGYMSLFTQIEETRALEASRLAAEPDEDGFITVTRGPRFTDVAREDEVRELVEKQKKREEGLGDFYRFQTREKRKERQNALLKRFDEDKRRIEKMKRSRGKIMPEGM